MKYNKAYLHPLACLVTVANAEEIETDSVNELIDKGMRLLFVVLGFGILLLICGIAHLILTSCRKCIRESATKKRKEKYISTPLPVESNRPSDSDLSVIKSDIENSDSKEAEDSSNKS